MYNVLISNHVSQPLKTNGLKRVSTLAEKNGKMLICFLVKTTLETQLQCSKYSAGYLLQGQMIRFRYFLQKKFFRPAPYE
jgi:hypothetical protein